MEVVSTSDENWTFWLYWRLTSKLTGKNFVPVKLGKMQFFKEVTQKGWSADSLSELDKSLNISLETSELCHFYHDCFTG